MAFKFAVVSRDGDVFETFESAVPNWDIGDTVILDPNHRYRVTATLPVERMAEFVDEPLYGVLEVEPLEPNDSSWDAQSLGNDDGRSPAHLADQTPENPTKRA